MCCPTERANQNAKSLQKYQGIHHVKVGVWHNGSQKVEFMSHEAGLAGGPWWYGRGCVRAVLYVRSRPQERNLPPVQELKVVVAESSHNA